MNLFATDTAEKRIDLFDVFLHRVEYPVTAEIPFDEGDDVSFWEPNSLTCPICGGTIKTMGKDIRADQKAHLALEHPGDKIHARRRKVPRVRSIRHGAARGFPRR